MKTAPLLFCTTIAIVAAMPGHADTQTSSLHASIEAALNASAAAWTAGDLDKFMQYYENSPTTRYINPSGITVGHAAIESMYAGRFKKAGTTSMGQLSLQLIDVKQVGPQYAFVVGRYYLKQSTGAVATGVTTLLFHKVGEQWLIVVDHTS